MKNLRVFLLFVISGFLVSYIHAQEAKWDVHNRTLASYSSEGITGIELQGTPEGVGLAWLAGANFSEGVIEFDIQGANVPGQNFVGIAFHAEGNDVYDCVYFRPFNFVAKEQARKDHMVQYVSEPGFGWRILRETRTGEFEAEIPSPPNPDKWFHAKIEVRGKQVKVFIDGGSEPVLQVEKLNERTSGKIGFWVGYKTSGAIANLKIME
ncbi:MAG: hypothetical protein AAF694_07925 [Bacteroidota bacterium]